MTHDEYLASIRADTDAMAAVARSAPLGTKVPSCPKWTIEELVEHASQAHRWGTGNIGQPPDAGPKMPDDSHPDDQPVADWLEQGADALLDGLSSAGPSQPCWTLTGPGTTGFWARRMALETAVHRWDAQNAAGTAQPVTPELAVDGINEYFELLPAFARFSKNTDPWGDGETIHFHATDQPGEWMVQLNPDTIEVSAEHGKGDAAARGTASDLYLFVLGRVPPSTLEVFGDASLLEHWQRRAKF
jgi:uncharacterized protein (TIGR03083 family)